MNLKIQQFQAAYNDLIDEFIRVYYDEESYPENYLEGDEKWMHPINICDEFWKIDEIYLALVVDAPKDKVRSWFDFCYHNYDKGKPQINFYNYLKLGEK